ncbi:MAG: YggS family pyridoxal phosphate-dependent enzyme [Thermicanus sp.]|nr:YggS family pyridoxal phosphate-dependent enzyme [Thermicanus sp.]
MRPIAENLQEIKGRIAQASARVGRNPTEIQMIAVTKYVGVERMREALSAGLTHFGESRAKDAKAKMEELSDPAITWHFIGHLQTNKVKEVLPSFAFIHSLDRSSLAVGLAKEAERLGIIPNCFIQVNVSGEESKFGIGPDKLLSFARQVRDIGNIRVVGLMTMAPNTREEGIIRPVFRRLRELQQELLDLGLERISPHFLSMGMSNDYEIAVEEGATHLRIGTALVGR